MGASFWKYLVAYQDDEAASLHELRMSVCAAGDYSWGDPSGRPRPTTLDDPAWHDEAVWDEGTHSILDIVEVAPAGSDTMDYCQTLVVSSAHAQVVFGTERPTIADIERVGGAHGQAMRQLLPGRAMGRHLVVYTDDVPSHLLFWGYSGD